jgi:hypothetical protein
MKTPICPFCGTELKVFMEGPLHDRQIWLRCPISHEAYPPRLFPVRVAEAERLSESERRGQCEKS